MIAAGASPLGLGNEFRANTVNVNAAAGLLPAVAVAPTGNFVITWDAYGQDGDALSEQNVKGQVFRANGGLAGSEFRVNTYTTGEQKLSAVAADRVGAEAFGIWMVREA